MFPAAFTLLEEESSRDQEQWELGLLKIIIIKVPKLMSVGGGGGGGLQDSRVVLF